MAVLRLLNFASQIIKDQAFFPPSFCHLQRNMPLYLSNAPALPLHSSVNLTCPEPSGPQVPFAQMTYITVEWKPPRRSIAAGLHLHHLCIPRSSLSPSLTVAGKGHLFKAELCSFHAFPK